MKLYEINSELENLIDTETGEIADVAFFEELSMERTAKIEGIALFIKNLDSDAAALKAEETALSERRRVAENTAARLKEFLTNMLTDGEKFETPRVKLSWRKSKSVRVLIPESDFIKWAKIVNPALLSFKEPTISKSAIKEVLESGGEITAATIVESNNLQIK